MTPWSTSTRRIKANCKINEAPSHKWSDGFKGQQNRLMQFKRGKFKIMFNFNVLNV